jgi:hypothetical protein
MLVQYLVRRHIKIFMSFWAAGSKVLEIRHHCTGSSFLSPSAVGQMCAALPHTSLGPPQHGTLFLFCQLTHNNSLQFCPTHPPRGGASWPGTAEAGWPQSLFSSLTRQPTLNPIFLSPCSYRKSSGMQGKRPRAVSVNTLKGFLCFSSLYLFPFETNKHFLSEQFVNVSVQD